MKEKIVKMLLELPPGVLQDVIDYGCLAILIVESKFIKKNLLYIVLK